VAGGWEGWFDELVELDPSARIARLEALRADDPELAAQVQRLLEADQADATMAEPVLARAPNVVLAALTGAPSGPGTLGPYRLLASLGTGGMGEVFRAERCDGEFEQEVAIKRIRSGASSEAILDRFIRERQILARLQHPGIARLLDGGRDDEGQPYFVMELVEGEPITEWCRKRGSDLGERVRLIAEVADAVDAAHRSLVVHRDLKPSNILVDAHGRPRLLDFGIATIVDTERDAALTDCDNRPFTPNYAAPEQILGEPITTGTDVWALGVLLFELLVERLPFPERSRRLPELVRLVTTETAPRPSAAAAAAEDLTLRPRARELVGDLDAIVLTALDRDPRRRYRSAAAFADDLRRYLSGLPVEAREPTLLYRARKLVARHRVAAAASALVLASLVVGLGVAQWQAHVAATEAERAEAVTNFLIDLFRASDPALNLGATLTAREILDEGAKRVETGLIDQPLIRGRVLDAIAQVERRLGLATSALARTNIALEIFAADPRARAAVRVTMAEILLDQGLFVEAQDALTAAAADRPELRRLVQRERRWGEGPRRVDPLSRRWHDARVQAAWRQHRLGSARSALEEILTELEEVPGQELDRAVRSVQLAAVISDGGEPATAATLVRQAMPALQASGGDPLTLASSHYLIGEVLDIAGDHDEATGWFRSGLAKLVEALGPDHPEVALREVSLGYILHQRSELDEADRVLRHAIAILQPLGHPDAGAALRYLGFVDMSRGQLEQALERFAAAEQFFAARPDQHFLAVASRLSRGWALLDLGRTAEARDLLTTVVAELEAIEGAEGNSVRAALKHLGRAHRDLDDPATALALHQRALEIERRLFATDEHLGVAATKYQIALDLIELGRRAEAGRMLDDAIATLDRVAPDDQRRADFLAARERVAAAPQE
jgi:serine/threonine-protein kinase